MSFNLEKADHCLSKWGVLLLVEGAYGGSGGSTPIIELLGRRMGPFKTVP